MTDENNKASLSLPAMLSVVSLIFVIFAAGWTLMQVQFVNVEKVQITIREDLVRREAEIKATLKDLQAEIDKRYTLFLPRSEYAEFQARFLERVNSVEQQVRLLEQTRPAASEIQAILKALEQRIAGLETRLPMRIQKSDVVEMMTKHDELSNTRTLALRREIDSITKTIEELRQTLRKP